MASLDEVGAAVRAVLDNSALPVFATMTFGSAGRTFLGTAPAEAAEELSSLGVDALGINCSLGPADLGPLVDEMLAVASCPVIVQANAGLPKVSGGQTVYTIGPKEYAEAVRPLLEAGVGIVGGCCGTDPSFIEALSALLSAQ